MRNSPPPPNGWLTITADAALGGERQQAPLDGAVVERVVELHEVELLGAQHRLELVVGALRVVGDAEIADAALGLPGAQGRQVRAPVEQVVDLHQVDAVGRAAARIDRSICAMPASRPVVQTLVARKALSRVPAAASRSPTTPSARAVHRRAVDHRAAGLEQHLQHLGERRALVGAAPTSKVRQVPQPTTGSGSPLDGIDLDCILSGMAVCPWARGDSIAAMLPAPAVRRRVLRVISDVVISDIMGRKLATSGEWTTWRK